MKILVIFLFSLVSSPLLGQEFNDSLPINICADRSYIKDYKPKKILSTDKIDNETISTIISKFQQNFGDIHSQQIRFTVGFDYDLEWLHQKHWKEIKDYQWEIPKYILNYAYYDKSTEILYCMHFDISSNGKIIKGYVPEFSSQFKGRDMLSKQDAIRIIINSKIKKKKLKKINLQNGKITYNSSKKIFEWEFGGYEKIWVEAFSKGKIRTGKFGGIYDF
jgi:hypothetical protein